MLVKATTHPNKIHLEVPNYQRLEWVGDMVLCIAARECLYKTFPTLSVKYLVNMETTLICNETLALLGVASGLHRFIDHCNPSLPSMFLRYKNIATRMKQSLWGTDPPKAVTDIIKALFGVTMSMTISDRGKNSLCGFFVL